MAGNVVEMVLRLKDGASASLKSAGKSAKATDIDMKKLAKGAAAVGAGFLAATALVVKFTQKMADYKNEVIDASTRTGVAVDTMAGLRLAAKGSGLQFSAMESVLKVYTSKIAAADRGTAEAVEGFENLGVSIYDTGGNLRDSDEIFRDTLAALGEMEPGTARTAAAVNALGTQSTKLFQALGDPKNLDHFVDKAKEFGVDFGPKAAAAAGDWQRAMADFDLVAMGAADNISTALGAQGMAGALAKVNEAIIFVSTLIVEWAVPTWKSLSVVIQDSATLFLSLPKIIELAGTALIQFLTGQTSELEKTSMEAERLAKNIFTATVPDMLAATTGGVLNIGDAFDKATAAVEKYESATLSAGVGGGGGGGTGGKGPAEALDEVAESAKEVTKQLTLAGVALKDGMDLRLIGETLAGMDGVGAALSTSRQELEKMATLQSVQAGGQAAAGFGQAILGGAGAPAVGGVSAIVSLLAEGPKAIRETAADLQKSLMTAMKTLPIAIGEILPSVLTKLPAAIVEAIPALIAGMVEATPKMMKAVAVDLPIAIGRAILEADWSGMVKSIGESFNSWWESIKDWIANLFSVVDRNEDGGANWKRIGLAAATGGASEVVRGVSKMDSFAVGARFVDRTGTALIHRGEQIVPRGGSTTGTAARTMGGGGGVNVTINTNVVDSDALPALVRQLERVFGTYGRSSSTLFAS